MDSGSAQEYDVFTSTLSASSDSPSAVGWLGDAGTSAAAPIWAGLIAIADQGRVLAGGTPLTGYTQTLPALYCLPAADYHDILYGNNGDPAGPGYDLASGLGTPIANVLVADLAGYQIPSKLNIQTKAPSTVALGGVFGLTVQVQDRLGDPVSTGTVSVALGNNPGGADLGGTLTVPIAVGLTTFSDLSLNELGSGYTLTVTGSGITGSHTTSSITVSGVGNSTKITITPLPDTPVFGQTLTLTAQVAIVGSGAGLPTGTVTFKEGSVALGSSTLAGGLATLSMTLSRAGTQMLSIGYGGDANDQPSGVMFPLTVAKASPTIAWSDPANITVGAPWVLGSLMRARHSTAPRFPAY
jgi:hypothetical protein